MKYTNKEKLFEQGIIPCVQIGIVWHVLQGVLIYRTNDITGIRMEKTMFDVLSRAGCFIAIIILGHVLRRVGFFKEGDFAVLSKITLKITLPAAFISNFSGKQLEPPCCLFLCWH